MDEYVRLESLDISDQERYDPSKRSEEKSDEPGISGIDREFRHNRSLKDIEQSNNSLSVDTRREEDITAFQSRQTRLQVTQNDSMASALSSGNKY